MTSPGISNLSTPGDFMQYVRNSASAPAGAHTVTQGANTSATHSTSGSNYSTKLQKCLMAYQDILWNGKPEKFPELKERVEGHFIQALMGHCVHPDFIRTYLVKEGKY
jgi:hypothetical protein